MLTLLPVRALLTAAGARPSSQRALRLSSGCACRKRAPGQVSPRHLFSTGEVVLSHVRTAFYDWFRSLTF